MGHRIQIVCRDWKDLVCNRGERCRYLHPPEIIQPETRLDICRDFQNRGVCSLGSICKHLHLNLDQESTYYKTGVLPDHGGEPSKMGDDPVKVNDFCRDELTAKGCDRGIRCKFRHKTGPKAKMDSYNNNTYPTQGETLDYGTNYEPMPFSRVPGYGTALPGSGARPPKRPLLPEEPSSQPPPVAAASGSVEKYLAKIDYMRKQIVDLRDTNEKQEKLMESLRKELDETKRKLEYYEKQAGNGTEFTSFDPEDSRKNRDADLYF